MAKQIETEYEVIKKVTIIYRRVVIAKTRDEARIKAQDMGELGAEDFTEETDWKATRR